MSSIQTTFIFPSYQGLLNMLKQNPDTVMEDKIMSAAAYALANQKTTTQDISKTIEKNINELSPYFSKEQLTEARTKVTQAIEDWIP